jgi:hypothetical protein
MGTLRRADSTKTTKAMSATRTTTKARTPMVAKVSPLRTRSITWPTPLGRPMTMPAKMSSEMPLPTPRSVICSPSHMTKTVPVVSVSTVEATYQPPSGSTSLAWSQRATMKVWNEQSTTVR